MLFWISFVILAALGAALRMGLNTLHHSYLFPQSPIPLGTFLANCLGSFIIGYFYAFQVSGRGANLVIVPAIMIAFLGALTTFSSFALDTLRMLQSGYYFYAVANVLVNNIVCITLCYFGFRIAH